MGKNRLLSRIISMILVLSLLPIQAFAVFSEQETADSHVVNKPDFTATVSDVNPEYAALGVVFPKPSADCTQMAAITVNNIHEAASFMREQLEDRVGEITVYVNDYDYDNRNMSDDWRTILYSAFEHTGVPTQGDYLIRHYGSSKGQVDYSYGTGIGTFTYSIIYDTTLEQENIVGNKIDELYAQWDNEDDFYDLSDYEKVKIIYDYICDNVVYDHANLEDKTYTLKYSAYAALINGTAVCQGYANLFYRMALKAGIDNRIIVGYGGGGYHGWNIVELDNKYYYLDSTWDAGNTLYRWFLLGSENFCTDHTPDASNPYDCDFTTYPIDTEDYDRPDEVLYSGTCGESITWSVSAKGVFSLTGSGAMTSYISSNDVPWADYRRNIKTVSIADGITELSHFTCYYMPNVTAITIPDSVTSIGQYAFAYCTALKEITIPAGITAIPNMAFYNSSALETVYFTGTAEQWKAITISAGNDSISAARVIYTSCVHVWDEASYSWSEDCTRCTATHSCTLCGATESETVTAEITEITAPTCTEDGTGIYTATFNSDSFAAQQMPCTIPARHTEETIEGTAATCTEAGLTEGTKCSACGEILTEQDAIPALGHEYEETVTSEPTYTETGIMTFTCIREGCGHSYTEVIPILAVAKGTCGKNLTWVLTGDGTLTISGEGAMYDYFIVSPWDDYADSIFNVVIGDKVTTIGDYAFSNCASFTGIVIPDSVTYIGDSAFYYCTALTDVVIGDGVTFISQNAFDSCTALTDVVIGDSVTAIDRYAFSNCSAITSITIPDSVTIVGEGVFYLCSSLTDVVIGSGLTTIGVSMFTECTALKSITIPNTVTTISMYAFADCSALTNITIPNSVTFIGEYAFQFCDALTDIVIPDSVTAISEYTFYCCSALTNIVIPDSVTSIGGYAFFFCDALTSITIPESVTSIGEYAFYLCDALAEVHFTGTKEQWAEIEIGDKNTRLMNANITYGQSDEDDEADQELLKQAEESGLLTYFDTVAMRGNTTRLDVAKLIAAALDLQLNPNAALPFTDCDDLSQLEKQVLAAVVEYGAMRGTGQGTFNPNGTATRAEMAVVIYNTFTKLHTDNLSDYADDGLFSDVTGNKWYASYVNYLASLDLIPVSEEGTFRPTDIITFREMLSWMLRALDVCSKIPDTISGTYGTNYTWTLTGDGTLTISGEGIMNYASSPEDLPWHNYRSMITKVVIEDGAKEITNYVFYGCSLLTDVSFPESVTHLGGNAFAYCTSLEDITLPGKLRQISVQAFNGCTALKHVTIPASVTLIYDSAFSGCSALETVTYIGGPLMWKQINIYYGNEFLLDAKISFASTDPTEGTCGSNMTWTYADGTLTISGEGQMLTQNTLTPWYLYRPEITTLIVNEGVTEISSYAFYNCTALTNVSLPESLTAISGHAFENCTSLENIVLPSQVTVLSYWVFHGCTALKQVTIPASVVRIEEGAFSDCTALETITFLGGPIAWANMDIREDNEPLQNASISYAGTDVFEGSCGETVTWRLENGVLTISGEGEMLGYSDSNSFPWAAYRDLITTVIVNEGITEISTSAFVNCTALTQVSLPASLTSTNGHCFNGCTSLESIVLPANLTSISSWMFKGCTALKHVTIPAGVLEIEWYAFEGCTALETVTFLGGPIAWENMEIQRGNDPLQNATVTCTGIDAVEGTCGETVTWKLENGTLTISGEGSMDDYYNKNDIPWNAYRSSITTAVVAEGVTSLCSYAFAECANLTSVTLPTGLTSLGVYVFRDCSALETIVLPDGLNSLSGISSWMFYGCSALKHVTIPASITQIGNGAFEGCTALKTVTFTGGPVAWECIYVAENNEPLKNAAVTCTGTDVFEGSCGDYSTWALSDGTLTISGSGTVNNNPAPMLAPWAPYASLITDVVIKNGVSYIGAYAFYRCTSLTNISIPDSVTGFSSCAFSYCTALESIVLPPKMTFIVSFLFEYCTALREITIPANVTEIWWSAFEGCTALETVYFTGSEAKWNAIKINSGNECLTNAKVICTGVDVMEGPCGENLTWKFENGTLTISGEGQMSYEGEIPWVSCRTMISKIVVEEGVTHIATAAFRDCPALVDVSLPESLSSLGTGIFIFCTALKSITLPGKLTSIPNGMFAGCSALESVVIPAGVTQIGSNVFNYCTALKSIFFIGTEEQWNAISIGEGNDSLSNAKIVYEYGIHVWNEAIYVWNGDCTQCTAMHTCTKCDFTESETVDTTCELVKPTCTTDGADIYTAIFTKEGFTQQQQKQVVPALGHDEQILPGKEATCTEEGLTEGKKCLTCGEITAAQEVIPAKGHTEEIIPGKEATFTEEGLTEGKRCTVCGEITVEQKVIPKLEYVEGTCGENVNWKLTQEGVLSISGEGAMDNYETGSNPLSVRRNTASTLGNETAKTAPWLEYSDLIVKVVVKKGVTTVGDNAFAGCTKLEEVEIPETVTVIGDNVFTDCEALETVVYRGEEEQWAEIEIGEGNETFEAIEVTVRNYIVGDVNGDETINVYDAIDLLSIIANGECDPDKFSVCDVNGDGTINVYDAIDLLSIIANQS